MKWLLLLPLSIIVPAAQACDCAGQSLSEARKYNDIVFRGTITELRDRKIYFQVQRVWKGKLTRKFAMDDLRETTACLGFWPDHVKLGSDLVVFARWLPEGDPNGGYFTDICTRTALAKDAAGDLKLLGRGFAPRKN